MSEQHSYELKDKVNREKKDLNILSSTNLNDTTDDTGTS
jgi:hypothetical protein